MKVDTWIGIAIAIAATAISTNVDAQKMYRCGNTYQETPCTGNQTATKELRASSAPTATASAGSDVDCSRLAEESQKISWAREGGATAEKQIADLESKGGARDKAEQRRLIESVYRKRGTAPEVRASIERDCLAEKEKMRQAAELARAAAVMSGSAQAGTSSAHAAQDAERQAERARKNAEQQQAQEKQRQCAKYRSQLADIEARYRGGSSSQATLSNLRDQRSRTEAKAREEGCEY